MPLNNFGVVVPDRLYRSAQPTDLGYLDAKALGISSVLMLVENPAAYKIAQGIFGPAEVCARPLTLRLSSDDLSTCVNLLDARPAARWLVHCTHGRDRTGAVIGAYRIRHNGWTLEEVNNERAAYGVTSVLDATFDAEIVDALRALAPK